MWALIKCGVNDQETRLFRGLVCCRFPHCLSRQTGMKRRRSQNEKDLISLRHTIGGKYLRTAAFAWAAPCASRHSCRALQRTCALDSLTLLGRVHHLPKIVAPLHVEPEVRAVAEDAGQDQGRRGGHVPAVAAQLVDVLALNAHRP